MQKKKNVTSIEELTCENCIYGEKLMNLWCNFRLHDRDNENENFTMDNAYCSEGRWMIDGKVEFSEVAYEKLYNSTPCCNESCNCKDKLFDWQGIVELLKREMPCEFRNHNTNVVGADVGKGLYVSDNAIEFAVKLYTSEA